MPKRRSTSIDNNDKTNFYIIENIVPKRRKRDAEITDNLGKSPTVEMLLDKYDFIKHITVNKITN
tara:strand:+ start:112 stop:306 length:195 start_codon:yes stop_codon:yes gene_type:complete